VNQDANELVAKLHREAIELCRQTPLQSAAVSRLHHSELADLPESSPIYEEWQTYRRELPRLLGEGHAGRFVLVKGDRIVDILATSEEAETVGRANYFFQPFLVQQIRECEPVLQIRGLSLPWRTCTFQSQRTA
jgi:hypothetical protein